MVGSQSISMAQNQLGEEDANGHITSIIIH